MKVGNQKVQSPPPKPPRRRYSDQLSLSSIGTVLSTKKQNEGNQMLKNDFQSKISGSKQNYLSLPASWTSDYLIESGETPIPIAQKYDYSNQLKNLKENEIFIKKPSDKSTCSEVCTNLLNCSNEGVSQFINQRLNSDKIHFKYQYHNSASNLNERFSKKSGSIDCDKIFSTTCKYDFEILKSSQRSFHRRHHSDSAIYCIAVPSQNDSLYPDSGLHPYSTRKFVKCHCICCSNAKKNYYIMQEIQVLKEINQKLWQHVCSLQTSLENIRKKTNEDLTDGISISGLLSSIYYAQKAKDCAMEERLKIALDERDAALHELENIISIDDMDSVIFEEKELAKNIKDLSEVGYSHKSALFKFHQKLLAQLYHFKERMQSCNSHELKHAVAAQDKAEKKVAQLEEEIKNLRMCYGLLHVDNKNWELTLFDALRELLLQRDSILSKIDNGLNLGSAIYRPQSDKSFHSFQQNMLSPPNSLYKVGKTHKSQKPPYSRHLTDYKEHYCFDTPEETKKLKEDVLFLNRALEIEVKKREQVEGKCVRLERLIHMLRKKLNGQNIGVLV